MELRHLRYFLAVCKEMNFTRAAEMLMIAQPPLSRQIKDLEEELGTPLFLRERHGLRLTDEGIMFRQYASRIVSLADRSVVDIREMHHGLQGVLYIAGVEGKAPHLISSWISEFAKLYPDVQYVLWNSNSDEVADRIRKGLSDIAVIMAPFDPDGLRSIPLYREPWIAMFSEEHPLAETPGDTVTLSMLAGCDLIIPSRASRLREINDWFAPLNSEIKVKARIAHVLNAYELCAKNVGVAIFPASAAQISGYGGLVQTRTIVEPSFMASYVLIYSDEHILSPVASRFINYLKDSHFLKGKI